ncbi:hypothetical protein QA601_08320 [Chitinispirillales bacterium ANBcel5]|uniref:hypothetical protein n=1 Tax=Cellulosispirillum alkaliphilum TaxID=3039283 RepID=UPI002A55F221|nr:hypothetical protein [Chitinispirillales bacterium ANBcel5]
MLWKTSHAKSAPYTETDALRSTSRELRKILKRLSDGKKGDLKQKDIADLEYPKAFEHRIEGFKVAENSSGPLFEHHSAASEIPTLIQKLKKLATVALSTSLNDSERNALSLEFIATRERLYHTFSAGVSERISIQRERLIHISDSEQKRGSEEVTENKDSELTTLIEHLQTLSIKTGNEAQSARKEIEKMADQITDTKNRSHSYSDLKSINNSLKEGLKVTESDPATFEQEIALVTVGIVNKKLQDEGTTKAFGRFNDINRNQIIGII